MTAADSNTFTDPKTVRDLLLLVLLGLVAYLPGLAAMPPIDRDEARYMQATVQMAETGELIDIRFQEDARHKKPAGAYWAQLGSLAVTGQLDDTRAGERAVWAHRLPSVLGALVAVIATYLAGLALLGRRDALLGAGFLALSVSLVFEAHIAKTDAMLAGATAVSFYGLSTGRAWPSWMGLAVGMLLKGPILLGVAALALLVDGVWNRSAARLRAVLRPLPILAALAIALPWFVAIGIRTDGAFFAEALGRDFGGKIAGAQETHGGPPGYYGLTGLAMFWPGILAVPLAALFAWRTRTEAATRWMVAWIVPMWIALEFVPTKLPHYTLPLYPALALLAAAGWARVDSRSRWAGIGVAGLVAVLLSVAVAGASSPQGASAPAIILGISLAALGVGAVVALTRGRDRTGLTLAALFLGVGFAALSRSPLLDLSPRLVAAAPDRATIVSPDYREPSLVFLAGTRTRLTREAWPGDTLVLRDESAPPECAEVRQSVSGTNYAKGDTLTLSLFDTQGCSLDEAGRLGERVRRLN